MEYRTFTIGGCRVEGFRVEPDGAVADFTGTLRNNYKDLARASAAARRKYKDSSITICETVPQIKRYRVKLDELLKISEAI